MGLKNVIDDRSKCILEKLNELDTIMCGLVLGNRDFNAELLSDCIHHIKTEVRETKEKISNLVNYAYQVDESPELYRNDIEPYDWMLEKWQKDFFKSTSLSTCSLPATKIRTAHAMGYEDVDGMPLNQWLPQEVIAYIKGNKALLALYAREVQGV